jgi:hypothetical protein
MIATKSVVRKCYSFSCNHNRKGICQLKQIDIYDNEVVGICLWHTLDMTKRVLNPYEEGKEIGKKEGGIELLDKLIKCSEDVKAIKDPKEFENWLKKHGIER